MLPSSPLSIPLLEPYTSYSNYSMLPSSPLYNTLFEQNILCLTIAILPSSSLSIPLLEPYTSYSNYSMLPSSPLYNTLLEPTILCLTTLCYLLVHYICPYSNHLPSTI